VAQICLFVFFAAGALAVAGFLRDFFGLDFLVDAARLRSPPGFFAAFFAAGLNDDP
jgi:hypothetical protein